MSKLNSLNIFLLRFGLLGLLSVFFLSIKAAANPTDLDLTFGHAGFVRTVFDHGLNQPQASALQPDGKLVVASRAFNGNSSEFSVARFNPDGTRDLSFGIGGYVNTPFRKGSGYIWALAIQPDGKIVVVGHNLYYINTGSEDRSEVAIARYNPDGSLDAAFGSGGTQTIKASVYERNDDQGRAVAIQDDGKILIAAMIGPGWNFGLLRLNPDGSLDSTFGSGGILALRGDVVVSRLAIQPDGKVLASGYQTQIDYGARIAALRLNADGSYDESFGKRGLAASTVSSGRDWGYTMLLQPDGKIVVAGYASLVYKEALVRFNTDGSMDTTFDHDGYMQMDGAEVFDTALQSDGSIVTAYVAGSGGCAAVLQRLTPSGQRDTTFGTNGWAVKYFAKSTWDYGAVSMVIDGNGKITLATSAATHDRSDTALIRLNEDGRPDNTYGIAGVIVTNSSNSWSLPVAARFQPDGKIVVAGRSTNLYDSKTAISRYNEDGSLDTSFNGTGKVAATIDPPFGVSDMETQSDGRILLIGSSRADYNHSTFSVIRYTSSGTIDTSFGNNGVASSDMGSWYNYSIRGLIQPDGKIILADQIINQPTGQSTKIGLTCFNPDGTLDTSFGVDGKVFTGTPGTYLRVAAIAGQSDGKILIAASGQSGNILIRYDKNGVLDTTFNATGILITPYSESVDVIADIKAQPDGKIVVTGASFPYDVAQFVILRYNADGSPDYGFGVNGKTAESVNARIAYATSLVIQPDGKYIVAGYRKSPDFWDYANRDNHTVILRFSADGMADKLGWGNRGVFNFDFDGGDALDRVAIDAEGRIVLAGYTDNNFAVARLKGDGASVTSLTESHK